MFIETRDEPIILQVEDHDFLLSGGHKVSLTVCAAHGDTFTEDFASKSLILFLARQQETHRLPQHAILHHVSRPRTMTVRPTPAPDAK
jgi:hypothetical protein